LKSKQPTRRVPRKARKKSFWTYERQVAVTGLLVAIVAVVVFIVAVISNVR
jgi:hypothetical protein